MSTKNINTPLYKRHQSYSSYMYPDSNQNIIIDRRKSSYGELRELSQTYYLQHVDFLTNPIMITGETRTSSFGKKNIDANAHYASSQNPYRKYHNNLTKLPRLSSHGNLCAKANTYYFDPCNLYARHDTNINRLVRSSSYGKELDRCLQYYSTYAEI